MRKFYYTVYKQLEWIDDSYEEATGWKDVTVYEIINDKPKEILALEILNKLNTVEEILNKLESKRIIKNKEMVNVTLL